MYSPKQIIAFSFHSIGTYLIWKYYAFNFLMQVEVLKAVCFVSDLDLECDAILSGKENSFFGINISVLFDK